MSAERITKGSTRTLQALDLLCTNTWDGEVVIYQKSIRSLRTEEAFLLLYKQVGSRDCSNSPNHQNWGSNNCILKVCRVTERMVMGMVTKEDVDISDDVSVQLRRSTLRN